MQPVEWVANQADYLARTGLHRQLFRVPGLPMPRRPPPGEGPIFRDGSPQGTYRGTLGGPRRTNSPRARCEMNLSCAWLRCGRNPTTAACRPRHAVASVSRGVEPTVWRARL